MLSFPTNPQRFPQRNDSVRFYFLRRFTAPQHTRSFCRLFHPTKSFACTAWAVFSFWGSTYLENFMSRPSVIPAFRPTPLQNRGRNFVRGKRRFTYMSSGTLYLFLRLNNSETTFGNGFERSGGEQEPSRGHKFSILENSVFLRDYTSPTLVRFRSALVGACLPQTLLIVRA